MLAVASNARIFFHQVPVDMRKGIEGLGVIIESHFAGQLLSGAYFVFVNKPRNRIKVLYWDNDGFAIWWKRLEKGTFILPKIDNVLVDRKAFFMMLEGITPQRIQSRFQLS